jgi:hypothetical protein
MKQNNARPRNPIHTTKFIPYSQRNEVKLQSIYWRSGDFSKYAVNKTTGYNKDLVCNACQNVRAVPHCKTHTGPEVMRSGSRVKMFEISTMHTDHIRPQRREPLDDLYQQIRDIGLDVLTTNTRHQIREFKFTTTEHEETGAVLQGKHLIWGGSHVGRVKYRLESACMGRDTYRMQESIYVVLRNVEWRVYKDVK